MSDPNKSTADTDATAKGGSPAAEAEEKAKAGGTAPARSDVPSRLRRSGFGGAPFGDSPFGGSRR